MVDRLQAVDRGADQVNDEEASFHACLLANGLPYKLEDSHVLHVLVTDVNYASKCHKWHMATGQYQGDWWVKYKDWLHKQGVKSDG